MLSENVFIITTTRAEYGLLYPIIKYIPTAKLIVSGTHLEKKWGYTVQHIDKPIHYKIPLNLDDNGDTPYGISKSLIEIQSGFNNIVKNDKPSLIILLGDRFELLGIAQIANIYNIPICHLAGGDTTEGAIDDNIRHCISKLSTYHLPFSETSKQKLLKLDIPCKNIFPIENPGITDMLKIPIPNKKTFFYNLQIPFFNFTILFIYHPETLLSKSDSNKIIKNIFINLKNILRKINIQIIFIQPNADTNNDIIFKNINNICEEFPNNCKKYSSLPRVKYINLLQVCNITMGNSSSGIYETPYFNNFTINIGNRQKGRLCATSVIHISNNLENFKETVYNIYNNKLQLSNIEIPFCNKPFYNTFDMILNNCQKKIRLIGAGGNAKVILEILKYYDYIIEGFHDDKITEFMDLKYLGKISELNNETVVCTIGNINKRKEIYNNFPNLHFPYLIHPEAKISNDITIKDGTIIYKNATIQPSVKIGKMCLINTSVNIDHESTIGNFCNINPNTTICGNVFIENECYIGANSTIIQGIHINSNIITGAGSVVITDLLKNGTYVGVPSKKIN